MHVNVRLAHEVFLEPEIPCARSHECEGRRRRLQEAAESGIDLVDVELRSGFDDVVAARAGRGLVVSFHDLAGVPDRG